MRSKSNLRKGEAGLVLVYVTIIVALAALIMAPLLKFAYTGHQSGRTREERMKELYAADAGIEDAMYQILNEGDMPGIGELGYGDPPYNPGTPDGWNDRDMDVTIEKVWIPEELGVPVPQGTADQSDDLRMVGLYTFVERTAAEDDFDEGPGWDGGTGWVADWEPSGSVSKGDDGGYSDARYLKFDGDYGSAQRRTSLTGFYSQDSPRLQFYANAGSFEPGDIAQCLVSTVETPGVGDWDILATWGNGDDTDTYEFVNIDISSYGNSSDFWVAFDADLTDSSDTVAWEDFESGDWSGGTGWNGSWQDTGSSYEAVTSSGGPYSGNYHLQLRSSSGDVNREVLGLSNYDEPQLQFYAKRTDNWESSDRAYLKVRSNEFYWTTIRTWDRNDIGTSYQAEDIDLSPYVSESTTWFRIRFDAGMSWSNEHFYVDDIEIVGTGGGHFYVDDLWVGNDIDAYTIEIAYTTDTLGPAWLDSVGIWLPPGWQYEGIVADEWDMPPAAPFEPYLPIPPPITTFAGGTVLVWDFSDKGVDLQQPLGPRPVVRSLTFTFTGGEDNEGIFMWMRATSQAGGLGDEYISWDTGYEMYRAVSLASHEIWGSNTKVVAYMAQAEIDKRGLTTYGNYQATGAPLLVDTTLDAGQIKETRIDPADPGTWTTVDYGGGDVVTYTGKAKISEDTGNGIPDDAEVAAAWLYWSAFQQPSEWPGAADEQVEFMYPKVYGPETFEVLDGDEVYTVAAYVSDGEPIVEEPRDVLVYLTPRRQCNELLGMAYDDNGNETFTTDYKPVLDSPAPEVYLVGFLLFEGTDYTIDYSTGKVTIINETLQGNVYIDYSISGLGELNKGSDYSVDYAQGEVTITNEYLVGNATVYYWAQHWETSIIHNAEDRYGTELDPAVKEYLPWGWFYACFADVTSDITGSGMYTPIIVDYAVPTGNGEYAVRGIDATQVPDSQNNPGQACYSGWSLIVLYESLSETAHQFYLYDPIHNPDECTFFSGQNNDIDFTLTDFYPPEGSVDGRMTYFVGEGDLFLTGDYLQFKGASQPTFPSPGPGTTLHDPSGGDPNGDWDNIINAHSTNGERGVDIDTFDILESVGDDTEADVRFHTGSDGWSLVYIVLSFKTEMVPKDTYFFNVAAVTYSYELGRN